MSTPAASRSVKTFFTLGFLCVATVLGLSAALSQNAPVAQSQSEALSQYIHSHRGEIAACHERALLLWPRLSGSAQLELTIEASGAVSTAQLVESTIAAPMLAKCIVEAVKKWSLPTQSGEVTFRIPLNFDLTEQARSINTVFAESTQIAVLRQTLRKQRDVHNCYKHALDKHDEDLSGRLVVLFTLNSKGKVSKVEIADSSLDNATLEQCIAEAMTDVRVPSISKAKKTVLKHVFMFKPEE